MSNYDELEKLKKLLNAQAITQEEYDIQKQMLLNIKTTGSPSTNHKLSEPLFTNPNYIRILCVALFGIVLVFTWLPIQYRWAAIPAIGNPIPSLKLIGLVWSQMFGNYKYLPGIILLALPVISLVFCLIKKPLLSMVSAIANIGGLIWAISTISVDIERYKFLSEYIKSGGTLGLGGAMAPSVALFILMAAAVLSIVFSIFLLYLTRKKKIEHMPV